MSNPGGDQLAAARTAEMTSLLRRWRAGDRTAIGALAPVVYEELKRLASSALSGRAGPPTLQPTALVHEHFVRLLGRPAMNLQDRHDSFALAANMLRQVLVDQARSFLVRELNGAAVP